MNQKPEELVVIGSSSVGMRDLAILATIAYSGSRIGALASTRLQDYYQDGDEWVLKLHTKGGKNPILPVRHDLQIALRDDITAAGIDMTEAAPRASCCVMKLMNKKVSPLILAVVFALIGDRSALAQQVLTTNLVTESKERVLRVESIIPASQHAVWKAFATEQGLKKWVAPVVALDLRVGGSLSTHYDKQAIIGSPGTIRLGIVHYLEGELMTYKVSLNSSFKAKVRAEDQNLQEVIQIVPWTNGTTKVISSMIGWGTGKEWDDTYNFFSKGNTWSYRQLVKSFSEETQ